MDIIARAEGICEGAIRRIVRKRFLWPNPNPDDELEDAWEDYEAAYARHVFGGEPKLSLTGMPETTSDQLVQAYSLLCDEVMKESRPV